MRKIFLISLFLSATAAVFGQRYTLFNGFGFEARRLKADSVMLIPSDTTANKTGIVRIGSSLYVGNGTFWTQVQAGAILSDSAVFSTKAYRQKGVDSLNGIIATKLGLSDSSLYATRGRLYKVADSLGSIISSVSADSSIFSTKAYRQKGLDSVQAVNAATYVPYTGATANVDLGAFTLHAQSLAANGTNGSGFLRLRHQASDATASGQTTSLFANSSGYLKVKNDGLSYYTFATPITADRTYTFQDKSGTVAHISDITDSLPSAVSAIQLNLSGAIHSTPVNFTRSGRSWSATATLADQSAFTIFRRGSGTGTPSFGSIDSSYFGGSFANQVRGVGDSRYGLLGSANTWTAKNTFTDSIVGVNQRLSGELFLGNQKYIWGRNVGNTAWGKLLGISSTNNVLIDGDGIGTSIGGNVSASGIITANANNGGDWFNVAAGGQSFGGYRITAGASSRQWAFRAGNTSMALTDVTASSDRLVITDAGNVGIGTNPSYKLHISQGELRVESNDQSIARITVRNTGTGGGTYSWVAGNVNLGQTGLDLWDGSATILRFAPSGAATFSGALTANGKATFTDSIVGVNQRLTGSLNVFGVTNLYSDLNAQSVTSNAQNNGNGYLIKNTLNNNIYNAYADGSGNGQVLFANSSGTTKAQINTASSQFILELDQNSSVTPALNLKSSQRASIGLGTTTSFNNGFIIGRDIGNNGTNDFYITNLLTGVTNLQINSTGGITLSGALTATAQGNNISIGVDSSVTTTTYTLVLGDAGYLKRCSNASAITITVPTNASVAFPIGTTIYFSQQGAGKVSVSPATSDVTIQSEGNLLGTAGQHAVIALIKVNVNRWILCGNRG